MSTQNPGPPPVQPSGIASDYVVLIAVQSVALSIAIVCVALRFYQQKRNWGTIWWDDWACLFGLTLCAGMLAIAVVSATVGRAGYHISTYTPEVLGLYLQTIFATEVLYVTSVSMAKLSVLFLYRRIFTVGTVNMIYMKALYFFVGAFFLSTLFTLIFTFNPVYAQWKPWLPHTHLDIRATYVATGAIGTCIDLAILAFPQTMVWKIQISRQKRVLISLVFMLGGFACVASIARLGYLATYDAENLTGDLGNCFLWTVLEPTVGIICSCLPILYKLFTGKDTESSYAKGSKQSGGNWSGSTKVRSNQSSHSQSSEAPFTVGDSIKSQHDQYVRMGSLDPVHVRREFVITDTGKA